MSFLCKKHSKIAEEAWSFETNSKHSLVASLERILEIFSSLKLQEIKEEDGEDEEDDLSSSLHLSILQSTLEGGKLEGRRKRERERERAVRWLGWENELIWVHLYLNNPNFAIRPFSFPLFTYWVKWRVICSNSRRTESRLLWKITYTSRYTRWYQEFPYSTKYSESHIYEKVLLSLNLSLKSFQFI